MIPRVSATQDKQRLVGGERSIQKFDDRRRVLHLAYSDAVDCH